MATTTASPGDGDRGDVTALLVDLDGVIYEGDEPVAGAADAVGWLREHAIPHLFVTNTTSRPRSAIAERLAALGVAVGENDILTPPVAAAGWLREHVEGPVALFVQEATRSEFDGLEIAGESADRVGAVVVGDYGDGWNFATMNNAFRLLMNDPQPALVALGMTRYWQAPEGLRLDTAPFVVALAHASGAEPVVLGKPAPAFFEAALRQLGARPEAAAMIGDDIRGDVGGAQAAGLAGIQVRTGKFRPSDLDGDIAPDLVIDSIAVLPQYWERLAAP